MDSNLKVLVACEISGRVRDAFLARGHDAWSCDTQFSDHSRHITGDCRGVLNDGWDLMIAHPPCTHLAVSGAWRFKDKVEEQQEALDFVHLLMDAPIPKIAVENPVSIISTRIRKPDQIIQPYEFGEDASKKTCLWLKNLPKLVSTKYVEPRWVNGKPRWANQTDSGQNRLGPSATRAAERGYTYRGIAEAMAEQWSNNRRLSNFYSHEGPVKTEVKATIRVEPFDYGQYERIHVKLPSGNSYTVTTDGGALDTALDVLIDEVLKRELGFTKYDLIKAAIEARGIR